MRNKKPGICYFCHLPVGIGEGHFELIRGTKGKFEVIHSHCVLIQREKKEIVDTDNKNLVSYFV